MNGEGFTLVELLIVIVLLGIVATVTVVAVRGVSRTTEENVCAMDRRILETASAAYDVATQGSSMPTERLLVERGFLRALSPNYELDGTGNVVPQEGGPNSCERVP